MEQTKGKPSLLGMFTKPGVQFDEIREQPVIWGPLAIITLVYFLISSLVKKEVQMTKVCQKYLYNR